jgi:CubicO group peptidase (beta-lactamase class C family)
MVGTVLAACLSGALPVSVLNANAAPVAAAPAMASAARPAADSVRAAAILRILRNRMASDHLRAAIVRVTIDGKELVTEAMGESMTGVPATRDMHVRNGAIAISYVATLLLQLVDEKRV